MSATTVTTSSALPDSPAAAAAAKPAGPAVGTAEHAGLSPVPPRGGSVLADWRLPQWTAFFLLLGFFCLTRFYDLGRKPIMHDESLFLYYTEFQMHRSWTYNYLPILHGPLHMMSGALMFHLFGDTDYTMRVSSALWGLGGFLILWRMRRFWGDVGMWAGLLAYTLSTGLAFYQRFYREDPPFFTITLLIMWCACEWWRSRNPRWLVGLLLSNMLLFVNKENSLIFYFSGATFVGWWMVQDLVQGLIKGKDARRDLPSYDGPNWRPKVPNVFWLSVACCVFFTLVLTQVFEGIRFDSDVVAAVGHDYPMKDVRSLELLLGILPPGTDASKVATLPSIQQPIFWRKVYGITFAVTLVVLWLLKRAIESGAGHKEMLTRLWLGVERHKGWFLAGVSLSLLMYIAVFTVFFHNLRGPFQIYKDTFGYWLGQHEWSRIDGPFHYHLTILMAYELPAILLILGGWFYAVSRTTWGRLFFWPTLVVVTALSIYIFNTPEWNRFMTQPFGSAKSGELFLKDILHLTSGVHLYLIFFLSFFCLVLAWAALWRGQILHAWLIWWTVTSIGGYAYAGEKVPWVGIHATLPIVLLAASYAEKLWHTPLFRRNRVLYFVIMGAFVLWNTKSMMTACFHYSGDIRERILYGHTTDDVKNHAEDIVRYVKRASIRTDWQRNHNDFTKLKDVKVLVNATDAAIWPLRWYLRDVEWAEDKAATPKAQEKYQFVFLDANDLDRNANIKEHYNIYRGRGRGFWQPQMPDFGRVVDVWLTTIPEDYQKGGIDTRAADGRKEWEKWIDYLIWRKTWEKNAAQWPSVSSVDYFFCVRKDIDL